MVFIKYKSDYYFPHDKTIERFLIPTRQRPKPLAWSSYYLTPFNFSNLISYTSFLLLLTNYNQFSGLKQHKFLNNSRAQRFKLGLPGLKSRCWQNCTLSGGSRGECVPCLLQLLRGSLHSLSLGCMTPSNHYFYIHISFSVSASPASFFPLHGSL